MKLIGWVYFIGYLLSSVLLLMVLPEASNLTYLLAFTNATLGVCTVLTIVLEDKK